MSPGSQASDQVFGVAITSNNDGRLSQEGDEERKGRRPARARLGRISGQVADRFAATTMTRGPWNCPASVRSAFLPPRPIVAMTKRPVRDCQRSDDRRRLARGKIASLGSLLRDLFRFCARGNAL